VDFKRIAFHMPRKLLDTADIVREAIYHQRQRWYDLCPCAPTVMGLTGSPNTV
jgi:hypothetical protein